MERYEIGKGMKEGLGFKRVMKEGKKGSGRELKERLRMKDGGWGEGLGVEGYIYKRGEMYPLMFLTEEKTKETSQRHHHSLGHFDPLLIILGRFAGRGSVTTQHA
ncbi:hypothetical protein Pcinc_032031 [Petrolisthes cinctipes]|uniref:Uncharacterized protein n=1 Tax=Petrolisthes cinctipes TaxID=88211 RepID=A0AAE1EVF1_PETCI|nr:hypothetical protein Pcinc_032031 [Petrolisthes cinctipes]